MIASSLSDDPRSASSTPPPSLFEKVNASTSSKSNVSGVGKSFSVPLLTEDQTTHDAIMDLIRKKKMREIASMQAARLKQQQLKEMNDDNSKYKERARKESRDRASAQVKEGMENLEKLETDKVHVEGGVVAEWKAKIADFDQRALEEEKEGLDALKLKHDGIVEKMLKDVNEENNTDRLNLTAALDEVGNEKKRSISDVSIDGEEFKSVVKQRELNAIMEEMNDLNKTKGQMVWLLKQVITAELTKKKKTKPNE